MKLTYIVNKFPKLSETFILGQITGLIDRGHEVEILSLTRPVEETVHEDVNKYGLIDKTHYINKSPSSLGFELNEEILSLLMLTDLIHAHFVSIPAEWAQTISEMFNIPFIITAHAYDIFIDPDPIELKNKFDHSTKVITISEYNKKYLIELLGKEFSEKIKVNRCGIDLEDFKYVKREPGKTIKILTIGRLVDKKGISYAIDAFETVQKEHTNTELRIIGDGELKDYITGRIKELGLEDKIILLGEQPKSIVLDELKGADIFLLPSVTANNGDREGIPVSIIEAQATGLPVVSTLHSGIPELVDNGKTGFLVPEKDTAALAEKLGELIGNEKLRVKMGKAGRSIVEKSYSRDRELDQLEELFKSLQTYNVLLSKMSEPQLNTIKKRAKLVGGMLTKLDIEIKDKMKQIRGMDRENNRKENELKKNREELKLKQNELQEKENEIQNLYFEISELKNTLGYKVQKKASDVVKNLKYQINKRK